MNHAIIVGATGLVGHSLTHLCVENPFFTKVTVISRSPIQIQDPKLENITMSDFSELNENSFDFSNDVIYGFCCLGTTIKKAGSKTAFESVDLNYVINFASMCKATNCKHLSIVSSLGASKNSLSFYLRVKGRMEQGIKALDFTSASIVRPSLLLGERKETRPGEDFMKKLAPLFIGRWKAIEGFSVAKAMMTIAQKAEPGLSFFNSQDLQVIADGT